MVYNVAHDEVSLPSLSNVKCYEVLYNLQIPSFLLRTTSDFKSIVPQVNSILSVH